MEINQAAIEAAMKVHSGQIPEGQVRQMLEAAAPLMDPAFVGYVIVEFDAAGKPDADWDAEIHPSLAAGMTELAQANDEDGRDDPDAPRPWFLAEVRAVDVAAMEAAKS